MTDTLRVAHLLPACETLGPGRRGVVWVAGCRRRCPGCVAEPILDAAAGETMAIDALADRIVAWPAIDGLTLTGGEPFEQADALARLIRRVQRRRSLSVLCYSGFTLAALRQEPLPGCRDLLAVTDVLIDGPFQAAAQDDLLWRGSSNQQVHFLTDRETAWRSAVDGPGAGVEVHVRRDGSVFWAGVPAPGFATDLASRLAEAADIHLVAQTGGWR